MVKNSNTKADYEENIAEYYAETGADLSISFADGKATITQDGQSATPLDYLEMNDEIYYLLTKTKAFTIDSGNNQIYEEIISEYITVKHYYSQTNQ